MTDSTGDRTRGAARNALGRQRGRIAAAPDSPGHQPSGPAARRRTSRTDRITTVWLVLAVIVAGATIGARHLLPQPLWTSIHVVTLGVLTNAIFQWSWYFTRALLHLPAADRRAGRDNAIRVIAFNLAAVAAFAGMWRSLPWLVVAAAVAIAIAVAWHGLALLGATRTRLGNRFAIVVRFYIAASAWFVLGCVLAALLSIAMLDPSAPPAVVAMRDQLTVAHALANVAGWVGLTMAGTLITLGPTMLRTALDESAPYRGVQVLIPSSVALAVAVAGALAGWTWLVGIGLAAYATMLAAGIGLPLVRTGLRRAPRSYATWTMTSALAWIGVAVLAIAWNAGITADAATLRTANLAWLALLGAGGLAQVFIASLSYLMPVVIGGGPVSVRAGIAVIETAGPIRATARTAALILAAVTAGSGPQLVRTVAWVAVLACYAVDVALLAIAGVRQGRVKRVQGTLPDPRVTAVTIGPPPPSTPPASTPPASTPPAGASDA